MAYERKPPKGSKFANVSSFEEPPIQIPPKQAQAETGFFAEFDQMHSDSFKKAPIGGKFGSGIKGPRVESLESLVAKLAELHFTVKGKIDEDGKVEMMFCSPEPIVQEEPPKRGPAVEFAPQPAVRYIEAPHRHRDKHDSRKGRKLLF
jgi:hypothetical protein